MIESTFLLHMFDRCNLLIEDARKKNEFKEGEE